MSITGPAPATDELAFIAARLSSATSAEQIFGALQGSPAEQLDQLRRLYRQLALGVHPDRHGNDPAAEGAFVALQRFYLAAQAQIADGRYGQATLISGSVVMHTRRRSYTVGAQLTTGDLAVLYTGTASDRHDRAGPEVGCILKISQDPSDNDLLANEASTLRHLAISTDGRPVPAYIPRLLESFQYQDTVQDAVGEEPRQVNAFPLIVAERGPLPADQFYTLREIREAYPDGVEAGHMAWIWRRLLLVLAHAHERDVIHGAVLPSHILIHPEEHGLLLVDWCASVLDASRTGTPIPVVSAEYDGWYPLAVLAKAPPTPAIDLEMGLRCMVYLLGGNPLTGALPPRVPSPIQTYLQRALWTSAARTDAGQLYRDFADLLADLWGRRRFIPFAMPARR